MLNSIADIIIIIIIMSGAGMDGSSAAQSTKKKKINILFARKNNKSHSDEIAWKCASYVMANVSVGLLFGRRKFFFRLR